MLYVFHGEPYWIGEKLDELSQKAREKDCEIFRLQDDSTAPLNSFLSRDLFGKKIFLIALHLLEVPERKEEIKTLAPDMARSENIIVLVENELSESLADIFTKAGAKIQEFKKPSSAKLSSWLASRAEKRGLNLSPSEVGALISEAGEDPFALLNKLERLSLEEKKRPALRSFSAVGEPNYFNFADAVFGKRKNISLSLLRSYTKDGLGAEEAYWKLWWKIKTLRMIDSGGKTSSMHPFVIKKATQDLANFSSGELKKLSYDLLDLFSAARRGEESFEEGLEKILIKL